MLDAHRWGADFSLQGEDELAAARFVIAWELICFRDETRRMSPLTFQDSNFSIQRAAFLQETNDSNGIELLLFGSQIQV